MTDVKFTIRYEVNTAAPIPAPRAILTMKVKTDEDGLIPVNVRCMDRILIEAMGAYWGNKIEGDPTFRIKQMAIESESWPAVTARVEENILGALARMQEADARYQKLITEQPADYVYETSVPMPATSNDNTFEEAELPEDAPFNTREWAQYHFGLSQLPCESASNFLLKNFVYIARYAKKIYGVWGDLSADQRYHAVIEWLLEYAEADDDDGNAYPIAEWIEWAKKHRA